MLKSFLKKVLGALAGRGLGALLGLVLAIALPKLFSLSQVGDIYFYLSQGILVSILIKFGLDYNLNSQLITAKKKEDVHQIMSLDLASFFVMLFIISVISFMGSFIFRETDFLIPIIWGSCVAINFYLFQYYKFEGKVFKASFSRSVINLLSMTVVLFLFSILFKTLEVKYYLYLHLTILLFFTAFNLNAVIGLSKLSWPTLSMAQRNIINNKRFFYYTVLLFFLSDIDIWFLKYYTDSNTLAVYATCKRFSLVFAIVIDLANLVIPNLYRKAMCDESNSRAIYLLSRRLSLFLAIVSVLIMFFVYAFSELLSQYIFEHVFNEVGWILIIFIFAFSFNLIFGFNEIYLTMKGEKDVLFKMLLMSVVLFVFLNLLLVKYMGGLGAASSFLIANLLYRVSLFLYVRSRFKVSLLANIV